ncbi:iron-dependent peroxidase [Paenibacillus glacialis]|uniref:Iron-dependent peroxidase n=1 Tax=Paenibacillus glacialis TaxID=494026 RepID=A0A168N7S9_9BACL|nr:iron-dependent peroxidase [Paenibacillus glacialis]OAB45494.1 iron-dependent peroxidase [Paenibacillus glacialis]
MGLNYIWDLIIRGQELGIAKKDIHFLPAKVYSPYMELSQEDLNAMTVERDVEVNPYYRFYDIFNGMFDINNTEDIELRSTLFDILIHFLADIDLMQGMNKREYYIRFVLKDIRDGLLGKLVQEHISLFDREEQETIAANVLRLYDTGEALHLLRCMVSRIFQYSTIYANSEEKDELLLYIGQRENETAVKKLQLIMELFLPIRYRAEVYWSDHFGIIDEDSTMIQDHIALY